MALVVIGCSRETKTSIVLNYTDFGPQVLAWQHIGMLWWQWEPHGDSHPQTQYDIKVVVYRDVSLKEIQKKYPVIPQRSQDYRYFNYTDALDYLNENREEMQLPVMIERFEDSKRIIINALGN